MGVKNRIEKFMQVEVEVVMKCMQINFSEPGLSSFGDFACFYLPSKLPNFSFEPWTIVHGGQKKESVKKIQASTCRS